MTGTWWALEREDVLHQLGSTAQGLPSAEAVDRAARSPRDPRGHGATWATALVKQFTSPIIVILLAATVISMAVGDLTDGVIIIVIILASGLLGFAQDFRAGRDVAALLARVQVETTVLRDGVRTSVPVAQVVPGDVVMLSTGSVIPADCRLLSSDNLLVDESTLTGESFPVEKDASGVVPASAPLAGRTTAALLGTHVVSGMAQAVAVRTGKDTELGRVTTDLHSSTPSTSYEQGISRFGYLLVRLMLALTVFIFIINAVLGRPILDSLLFSLALAVGLTPQMLPAIVAVSLSTGARLMATKKVIVKRLEVIEDLGSMRILCTDKTGTLTEGAPRLDRALDLQGHDSDTVLRLASLNAGLQIGFVNPMDAAIIARQAPPDDAVATGEVPYDFSRKRLSVLTLVDGSPVLIVKGAVDGVVAACTSAVLGTEVVPVAEVRDAVSSQFETLSAGGYRVVAVATRTFAGDAATLGTADEQELTLAGLLAFHDPVKPTATAAVAKLGELGISLRLITGDNALAARATAESVGLAASHILVGSRIDALDDEALSRAVADVRVFAEAEPHHKRRIVLALRAVAPDGTGQPTGHRDRVGVGFLGDGINDAPALHAADVGISVDTAVDVAKEAAAIVLLDKDLGVVIDGVRVGRETFANTLKYARLTTSANFGNMLSMAIASLFLPFLPLLPRQILLLNFLTDFPATAIASDRVDPEQTEAPAEWDIGGIRRFMLVFGAVSTAFDLLTFAVLVWGLDAGATEFRSAWFIESAITELLVLFSLRTRRSMFTSRPSRLLVVLSVVTAAVVVTIPFVPPVAHLLGLSRPGPDLLLAIGLIAVGYLAVNEAVKHLYFHRSNTTASYDGAQHGGTFAATGQDVVPFSARGATNDHQAMTITLPSPAVRSGAWRGPVLDALVAMLVFAAASGVTVGLVLVLAVHLLLL